MATCVTPPPIASSSKNRADCRYNWIIHKNIFFLYLFYNSVQLYTGKLQKTEKYLALICFSIRVCSHGADTLQNICSLLQYQHPDAAYKICRVSIYCMLQKCFKFESLSLHCCRFFLQNLQLWILYTLTFFSIFTNLQQIPTIYCGNAKNLFLVCVLVCIVNCSAHQEPGRGLSPLIGANPHPRTQQNQQQRNVKPTAEIPGQASDLYRVLHHVNIPLGYVHMCRILCGSPPGKKVWFGPFAKFLQKFWFGPKPECHLPVFFGLTGGRGSLYLSA